MTSDLPKCLYIRASDVINSGLGITKRTFYKAVESGALPKHRFPGRKYAMYRREEVLRVFQLEKSLTEGS